MTTIQFDVLDKLDKNLYEDMSDAFKERTLHFHKWFKENERIIRGFDDPDKLDYFLRVTLLKIMERIANEQDKDLAEVQRYFDGSFHP